MLQIDPEKANLQVLHEKTYTNSRLPMAGCSKTTTSMVPASPYPAQCARTCRQSCSRHIRCTYTNTHAKIFRSLYLSPLQEHPPPLPLVPSALSRHAGRGKPKKY
ncbi:hypothetical protein K431DRAFT_112092 [Polychaeton citri CBS 116435]|uniref:Uncharacterized protein n=1 Tax=Polychaeton citri CBS 116435 TaxID=1314669 RepID=A0A9P4Q527_9PEZI|nr:hypothetical protein K431DRAFT_112092 [Polychaeton citri CBS 116435]